MWIPSPAVVILAYIPGDGEPVVEGAEAGHVLPRRVPHNANWADKNKRTYNLCQEIRIGKEVLSNLTDLHLKNR